MLNGTNDSYIRTKSTQTHKRNKVQHKIASLFSQIINYPKQESKKKKTVESEKNEAETGKYANCEIQFA